MGLMGDSDTRSVWLMSTLLRNFVVVDVVAEKLTTVSRDRDDRDFKIKLTINKMYNKVFRSC